MPPRRSSRNNSGGNQEEGSNNHNHNHNTNHNNNNNNNNNGVDAQLAAIISQQMAQQIATLVPNLLAQVIQMNGNGNGNGNCNGHGNGNHNGNGNGLPACTLKHFKTCNPPKFSGDEGATGLIQWFEGIENTFINSEYPDNFKVRYAMSVLHKRALTWWNEEKRTRGAEVARLRNWRTSSTPLLR